MQKSANSHAVVIHILSISTGT